MPKTPISLEIRLKGWESYRKPYSRVVDLSSEKPFTAIGEVVWCRPKKRDDGYDVGIRFLDNDENDYTALTGYLRAQGSVGAQEGWTP